MTMKTIGEFKKERQDLRDDAARREREGRARFPAMASRHRIPPGVEVDPKSRDAILNRISTEQADASELLCDRCGFQLVAYREEHHQRGCRFGCAACGLLERVGDDDKYWPVGASWPTFSPLTTMINDEENTT